MTRAERIEEAAKLLAAHIEQYHNGDPDCWVCHGWLPDEHDKDCALIALRVALAESAEPPPHRRACRDIPQDECDRHVGLCLGCEGYRGPATVLDLPPAPEVKP